LSAMSDLKLPLPREIFRSSGFVDEVRESQVKMSEICLASMISGESSIVEAPTGTGKGLAYLIPAILYAKKTGQKVVVSTATTTLQDQLFHKDIPYLQKKLYENFGIEFTAALVKGRSHYLCRHRLDVKLDTEPMAVPLPVLAWGRETETGDVAEVQTETGLPGWSNVNADYASCNEDCDYHPRSGAEDLEGSCFFYRAKTNANQADVIVANHALVALSIIEGKHLPEYKVLVVDEAHQFEKYMVSALTAEVSHRAIMNFIDRGRDAIGFTEEIANDLVSGFKGIVGTKPMSFTIDPKPLTSYDKFKKAVMAVGIAFEARKNNPRVADFGRFVQTLTQLIDNIENKYSFTRVEWRPEVKGADFIPASIQSGPINVAYFLRTKLYPDVATIFTSATLSSTGNTFTYFKKMMGVEPKFEVSLPTPFDYPKQCLLYIPKGGHPVPSATDRKLNDLYQDWFAAQTLKLLELSKGRAFVLFTSYAHMNIAFEKISKRTKFPCKKQGESSREFLVRWFKETPNSVLFGTKTFWEGISIDGDDLSLVVIDKVPFKPESDPLMKAKAEHYKISSMFDYIQLPEAIIDLKQGFGRLIRTRSDKGIVAILDPRIHNANYGKRVINALPPVHLATSLDDKLFLKYLP
jgi:ATP-dependent DNA helicase DinG